MTTWKGIFRGLKEKIFGKHHEDRAVSPRPAEHADAGVAEKRIDQLRPRISERDPYFVQIGFDFGTSYSKCICRDVMTNKAWIFIPTGSEGYELPFLIPSTLIVENGRLSHANNTRSEYRTNGLYHLKHALEKVALSEWDDPVLKQYKNALADSDVNRLGSFLRICAVYYLAGVLGEVRTQIRKRLCWFGSNPDDYIAVNLAVPVADAERPTVNQLYQQILCDAWFLADRLRGHPTIEIKEVERLINEIGSQREAGMNDACFIYPETSANVQAFVRSRASRPGIYLFSDTGAGTVDQSVFIFLRRNGIEHLTYLHAGVIPLGSSLIERQAALEAGRDDWKTLEMWREKKEQGEPEIPLIKARKWIHEELSQETLRTLAKSKHKLIVKEQLDKIRVIFGGGGHCEHPYKTGVIKPFSGMSSGSLFKNVLSPEVVGMPVPIDLELEASNARWMRRLSVAYGLSFERSELTTFTYPVEAEPAKPEEVWRPKKKVDDAPGKEEC